MTARRKAKPVPVGTVRRRDDGRVAVYAPGHPTASRYGWALRHRLTAFDAHGSTCRNCRATAASFTDCQVLHLNGNLNDDRPENLCVCCGQCAKVISFGVWVTNRSHIADSSEGRAVLDTLGALLGRLREGPVGAALPVSPFGGTDRVCPLGGVDG